MWILPSVLMCFVFFYYFYLFTQAVRIRKCLLQHITSFCCLLGLVTSVPTMSLAGHGCQLQAYDRVPSALFMEMSHWGKMAYSFRPMYGGMNNGWRDGGAKRNCLSKLKICSDAYLCS